MHSSPRSLSFLVALCFAGCAPDEGLLGVNEVARSGWIELLNDDVVERSFEGWTFEVDGERHTLPSDWTLAPGELRIVDWFNLPARPFIIEVRDLDDRRVQRIGVPDLRPSESFGRVPDDEPNWQVFGMPSPAERNR